MNIFIKKGCVSLISILFLLSSSTLSSKYVDTNQNLSKNIAYVALEEYASNISYSTIIPIKGPFITFNSYVQLDVNDSVLNEPIPIDIAITIPITISYFTDIPQVFQKIPWLIRNFILFFTLVPPIVKLPLEVLDKFDDIDILFPINYVLLEIPFKGDIYQTQTNLIICAYENALSTSYTFDIQTSVDPVGRLNGYIHIQSLDFFVEYRPDIVIDFSAITVTPRNQTTVIPLNVTNYGNWRTSVTANILVYPTDFDLLLIPPSIILELREKEQFFLIVIPPSYFVGYEIIQVQFNARRYPIYPGCVERNYTSYIIVDVV